jgi:maltose phosphorylase
MAKVADKYLVVDAWKIIEEGFHADRSRVSESLFSLGNEHQGVRGFFEEGYSGESLIGVYLNGIYEERFAAEPVSYKGISNRLCFMVNTVNWLHTRIVLDGETLDLAKSKFSAFRRELDFRSGELKREFVWETSNGHQLKIVFSRLLSMEVKELACQRISMTPLNFSGTVKLTLGLDFSVPHSMFGKSLWSCPQKDVEDGSFGILGVSEKIGHRLFAGFKADAKGKTIKSESLIGMCLEVDLVQGRESAVSRTVIVHSDRDPNQPLEVSWTQGMSQLKTSTSSYEEVYKNNAAYWDRFWSAADITIDGDEDTQQGIRFCIFQMQQTFRGIIDGANIGAKGLTGEAYNGNAFWDTETYCLPFYLFSNPSAAKSLLEFRYKTLPQALERAKDLDCSGACYPIATIDGTESCTLWQHASLQFQPTTAVAYAIAHYMNVTGDAAFLEKEGAAILVQICRFLASRGQWSQKGDFGYYAVMGPDEFQMMVNNNAYTNYMAKRTFEYALEALKGHDLKKCGTSAEELNEWHRMAEKMFIPYDSESGLYEQHEGFFNLPHLDVDSIPVEDFPLYHHWSYDRIYRNDMIKQPDVLMFIFLYNGSFPLAGKRANYDYYKPRCIHESSLSPSVHSILAAELGKHEEAFEFFRFATRIDLDNYNRNTGEGIHTTSIAAAWMNIVYGFGGMRSDGDVLSFQPSIPAHWNGYSFQVFYRGAVIRVEVSQNEARLRVIEGNPVVIKVNDQLVTLSQEGISISIHERESMG